MGEKLFVRLLVSGGFGEVKTHESDEGVDILDGHGLHVAELRSRVFDRGDVVKIRSHGDILETKTRLEATGKELVSNRGTCEGVQEKDFGPGSATTVRRAWFDFRIALALSRMRAW